MPTLTQATIRLAMVEDMPKVLACLWRFVQETPWKMVYGEPDPLYAGGWIISRLENDPNSQLFVAEHDGELVGLCGGSILQLPMVAHRPYIWEWIWWVTPELRQTELAESLWQHLVEWAKTQGATGSIRGHAKENGPMKIRETLYWEFW